MVIYKEIYEEYGDSFSNQLVESRVFESLLSSFKLNSCKANNGKNVIEFVISNKKRSFRQILLVKSDRNLNAKDFFEKSYIVYADFECSLCPSNDVDKIAYHKPNSACFYFVCTYDNTKNKLWHTKNK